MRRASASSAFVIVDAPGSVPTTRMSILPETLPVTRPPNKQGGDETSALKGELHEKDEAHAEEVCALKEKLLEKEKVLRKEQSVIEHGDDTFTLPLIKLTMPLIEMSDAEKLRLEMRESEHLRKLLAESRAQEAETEQEADAHAKRLLSSLKAVGAEAQRLRKRDAQTIQRLEHTIETLVARCADGTSATATTHDIQKKDEELREKDEVIMNLTDACRASRDMLREKDEVIVNLTGACRAAISRA